MIYSLLLLPLLAVAALTTYRDTRKKRDLERKRERYLERERERGYGSPWYGRERKGGREGEAVFMSKIFVYGRHHMQLGALRALF